MVGQQSTLPDTKELQSFVHWRHEWSVKDGCLLRGSQVIVPLKLRSKVVDQLHEGYPGIAKMKALAQQQVW